MIVAVMTVGMMVMRHDEQSEGERGYGRPEILHRVFQWRRYVRREVAQYSMFGVSRVLCDLSSVNDDHTQIKNDTGQEARHEYLLE